MNGIPQLNYALQSSLPDSFLLQFSSAVIAMVVAKLDNDAGQPIAVQVKRRGDSPRHWDWVVLIVRRDRKQCNTGY
jgi:hypothetical protein